MGASNSREEAEKAAAARRLISGTPHSGETVSIELTAERKENIRLQDEIWASRLLNSQLEARLQAVLIRLRQIQDEHKKALNIHADQSREQKIQITQLIHAEQIKSGKFQDERINAQQIQNEQEKALQIQAKQIEQMKARLVEEQIPHLIQAKEITAQQIQAEQIEAQIIQFEQKAQLIQAEQIKTLHIQVEQKNALQIQAQKIITQQAQIEQMKAQLIQAEQSKTQLIRDVQIPREHLCPNVRLGCTIPVLNQELLAHGKACLYRPYQCPMKSCSWQGNYSKLYCHAEEAHTPHTGIHFGQKSRLLLGEGMMLDGMLLRHEELVFKLNARPTQTPLAMCWALQLLGPPAEAANWKYQIQINKTSDEVKRLYISDACLNEDDDADDVLNEGRCPSAAFIMLNNFQLKKRISFKVNIYKESQLEQPVSVCVDA